ncbi:MAG: FtsX-like permease family protein [Planctomycetota bacterium]
MYKYFLGLKYLLSRWINLLCILGVAVAVWALILFGAVFSGFVRDARELARGPTADLYAMVAEPGPSFDAVDAVLRRDPQVAATAPRMVWYGLLHTGRMRIPRTSVQENPSALTNFIQVLGVDPRREAEVTGFADWVRAGREATREGVSDPARPFWIPLERVRKERHNDDLLSVEPGLLLGAERSSVFRGGAQPGDKVTLTSGRPAGDGEVRAFKAYFTISGVFATPEFRDVERDTCFVDIWELRAAFGHPIQSPASVDVFHEVAIRAAPGAALVPLRDRLERSLRAAGFELRVFTWEDRKRDFLDAIDQEQSLVRLILFVLMVVACFLIFATQHMMVTEKTRDIGVLSALGATRRGVMAVFLINGIAIGGVGTLLGLVTGVGSTMLLNPVDKLMGEEFGVRLFPYEIYGLQEIPWKLEPLWISAVCVATVACALAFSALPALRAARQDPVESLRYE